MELTILPHYYRMQGFSLHEEYLHVDQELFPWTVHQEQSQAGSNTNTGTSCLTLNTKTGDISFYLKYQCMLSD